MQTLKISAKKGKKNINVSLELPGSWEEVTEAQFLTIFKILFTKEGFRPSPEIRVRIVRALIQNNGLYFLLNAEEIFDISEAVNFIWATPCPRAFIKHYRGEFFLPGDYMENASWIEYITADSFLSNFHEAKNKEAQLEELNKLAAVICRPKKWFWFIRKRFPALNDGDCREKFNQAFIEDRAREFARIPLRFKLYVLYYFIACKFHIVQSYPLLFPKKTTEEGAEGGGWLELLQDVASLKIYGNYEETAFYNLHTVLTNLELLQKRKIEQNTKKTA